MDDSLTHQKHRDNYHVDYEALEERDEALSKRDAAQDDARILAEALHGLWDAFLETGIDPTTLSEASQNKIVRASDAQFEVGRKYLPHK